MSFITYIPLSLLLQDAARCPPAPQRGSLNPPSLPSPRQSPPGSGWFQQMER